MKRFLILSSTNPLIFGSLAQAVIAAPPEEPGRYGTAAPTAQCDSGASSGAFNYQNEVYGETPSGNSNNFNSSEFGQAGGSGGGQTGINNSSVCGNRQGNLP